VPGLDGSFRATIENVTEARKEGGHQVALFCSMRGVTRFKHAREVTGVAKKTFGHDG